MTLHPSPWSSCTGCANEYILSEAVNIMLCVYHICMMGHMCVISSSGKTGVLPDAKFKEDEKDSLLYCPPAQATFKAWLGSRGAKGVAQRELPITTTSLSQVTQWLCCIRPVASPTWQGLHSTSSVGLCLSSRRREERPTSCQCWRESRYLLGKDHRTAPLLQVGDPEAPEEKGWIGSRAHSGLRTQPRQNSGTT